MSTKLEELGFFYAQQLADVGVTDQDGSGMLSYLNKSGKYSPVLLKKKRLCLLTRDILMAGDWETRTAFHPLSEQINCGPSDVLNAFKDYIRVTTTEAFSKIALLLMNMAITSDKTSISAKSMDIVTQLADADSKTYDTLVQVLQAVANKPEKRFVTIILKSNHDKQYLRNSVVSFPILDSADDGDQTTFFGVKMPRKTKDKRLIVSLLQYILGEDYENAYTKGSNDKTAPFYHSLLLSFEALANRINHLVEVHSSDVDMEGIKFGLKWVDTLRVFATFAALNESLAPPVPGNRGVLLEGEPVSDLTEVFNNVDEEPSKEIAMEPDYDPNREFDPYGRNSRRGRDIRRDRDDDYRYDRERRYDRYDRYDRTSSDRGRYGERDRRRDAPAGLSYNDYMNRR